MKLDTESLNYITNVVETAQLVGIDNIVIEPGTVRALNDEKSVVLFQDENVPDIGFSVGLNRVNVFLNRLEVAKTQDNFAVNVTTDDEGEFARSFTMTAKGFKVDYRCANPKTIKAPKRVNDEMVYKISLTPQAVFMLQKGQTAMGADIVSLICKDGEATFEYVDVNNDKFSHTFADNVTGTDDFTHNYPIKILLPLFKHKAEAEFQIGRKGMLCITVNTLTLFVLPQL
jgi:histidyl-tRNA synthetase